MSTLAEIEEAVPKLTLPELEHLQNLLSEVRRKRSMKDQRGSLAEFAGVLRLSEDPVEWQERVRGDWR